MDPDLTKALRHFKRADPVLYEAGFRCKKLLLEKPPVRGNIKLFESLAESVVSQQLAVKAADAIWARVETACGGKVTPESIQATSLPRLRKAGLSNAKAKTLREVSKAMRNGLNLSALRTKSPEEATEALVKIWGIGPWTAEMFLMFGLKHPDIFSSGDLGLVRSMETLYGLKNPSKKNSTRLQKHGLPIEHLLAEFFGKREIQLNWDDVETLLSCSQ